VNAGPLHLANATVLLVPSASGDDQRNTGPASGWPATQTGDHGTIDTVIGAPSMPKNAAYRTNARPEHSASGASKHIAGPGHAGGEHTLFGNAHGMLLINTTNPP
jgi:hypothetical protein